MEKEASRIPLGLPEECAFHELGTGDLRTASDQLLALVNSIQDILLLQMKNGAYASCGATVPLPNIPIHSVLYESPGKEKDASRKITDLIHRRIPLGVQFDSCLVFGGCAEKREIDHTMIIVGRRWNPAAQSCELLLRNSYGNRCPEPLPDATRCEAGNWWIAQEKLSESPLEFIFVDR